MHSILLERRKSMIYFLGFFLVAIALLIPTMFASATSIGTNVSVTGTFTVTGVSTLSDDLDPDATDTINLGAYGYAWNDVFVSGTSYLGVVAVAGDLDPTTDNSRDIGQFGSAWNELFVSGTSYLGTVTFNGDLDPSANNTINLGAFGLAWNDIMASGTVSFGSGTVGFVHDGETGRTGISSSTPSAMLSVGESSSATTSLDFAKPCFRFNVSGAVVYYYPSVGEASNSAAWSTSSASCF
jgi:hypothetical protein